MPLTLTLTQGVLPEGAEADAIAQLTHAMLDAHGLADNALMARNITAQVNVLPKQHCFSGGKPFSGAWIEWKVPAFAFSQPDVQQQYCRHATDIIEQLSGHKHPRENIYINVVHAVDGAWNFEGAALTNVQILGAISENAATQPN
ncbi:4-oxalocrotonate tautomerase [Bowmanella denitrificans]|uniref:4-oxalocrotonate tautomerase n=1 Tax=Bowmanella denitrificans TaxID=366582 RepID=UPI000C99C0A7|nr:4-oxalocrotonate tautomerase [Bowmanella denitrificans]